MKKKLLTGLLLGALVAVMLTGCGGKKNITKMTDEELGEYINEMSFEEYDKFMLNLSPEEQERYDRYLCDTLEISYTEDDSASGRDDDFDDQGYFEEDSEETGASDTEDAAQQEVIEPTDEILDADWTDFKLQVDHTVISFQYPMTVAEFVSQFDEEEYEFEELDGLCKADSTVQVNIRNKKLALEKAMGSAALSIVARNKTEDISPNSDCIIELVGTDSTYRGSIYFAGGLKGTDAMVEGDETYTYGALEDYMNATADRVSEEPHPRAAEDDSLLGSSVACLDDGRTNLTYYKIHAWSKDPVDKITDPGTMPNGNGYLKAEVQYLLNMSQATYYGPTLYWEIDYINR